MGHRPEQGFLFLAPYMATRKMKVDRENKYLPLVLSDIGVDSPLCEELCDMIEKSGDTDKFRIVRDSVSNERLLRWLNHPNGNLRYLAIAKLGERMPAQIRMALLNALDDADENVVRAAQRCVGPEQVRPSPRLLRSMKPTRARPLRASV
jgi:hypothetical protein